MKRKIKYKNRISLFCLLTKSAKKFRYIHAVYFELNFNNSSPMIDLTVLFSVFIFSSDFYIFELYVERDQCQASQH